MTKCYQAIARNIKEIRLNHNMTQKEFAKVLNLNACYYARLERGDDPKRHFTLDHIMILCKIYNVDPHSIITVLPEANELDWIRQDCSTCKYGKYNDIWKTKFCYHPDDCKDWNLWEAKE